MTKFYATPTGEIMRDAGGNVESSTRKPLYFLDFSAQDVIDILALPATDPVRVAYTAELAYLPTVAAGSAPAFVPTGTSVPVNGMYLLAANQTAFASNSVRFLSSTTTVTSFALDIALTQASQTTIRRADVTGYMHLSGGGAVNTGMNLILGGQNTSGFANQVVFRTDATTLLTLGTTALTSTVGINLTGTSNLTVSGSGLVGYGTGAGGAVTQITGRTTGVTLNKSTGAITLVSAAGTASWQSFTVANSVVGVNDVVKVCQKSGTDLYMVHVTAVAAGSFRISFATTGGTTTETPVFSFAVVKGAVA